MRVINIPYLMSLVLLTTLVCSADTVTPLSGQVELEGNVADDGDYATATSAVDFPPVYFERESDAFTRLRIMVSRSGQPAVRFVQMPRMSIYGSSIQNRSIIQIPAGNAIMRDIQILTRQMIRIPRSG